MAKTCKHMAAQKRTGYTRRVCADCPAKKQIAAMRKAAQQAKTRPTSPTPSQKPVSSPKVQGPRRTPRRHGAVILVVPAVVAVALAVGLAHEHHVVHVAAKPPYPAYSLAACSRQQVFTWYDRANGDGTWTPILCGEAPPSDTGNWGANLPLPGQTWPPTAAAP